MRILGLSIWAAISLWNTTKTTVGIIGVDGTRFRNGDFQAQSSRNMDVVEDWRVWCRETGYNQFTAALYGYGKLGV